MPVYLVTEDELYHHGIKGQQWYIKNGPPYPLDKDTHNRVVKRIIRKADSNNSNDVQKFNRFLATTVGIGRKKMLTAEERERQSAQRKETLAVDTSLKLPLKDRSWSIEEDVAAVNPGYGNFNNNTEMNCGYCAMTLEMRRRGFDVTARKDAKGLFGGEMERCFEGTRKFKKGGYLASVSNKDYSMVKDTALMLAGCFSVREKQLSNEFASRISKQPVGARGLLNIAYGPIGGHALAYEKKKRRHIYL